MAAAAVQPGPMIDLKSQAAFPIRLGSSIVKPAGAARYASIQYNYRPSFKKEKEVKGSVDKGGDEGESRLLLQGEDGEYSYNGSCEADGEIFVLVVQGEGKEREMVLEKLDGRHTFNLASTPVEEDAAKLAQKHPHISSTLEDDLFGDEDLPPDDSNPFDYRHFLKEELEGPENTQPRPGSTVGTPRVQPSGAGTPVNRPAPKSTVKAKTAAKRKTEASKPDPKRVKAGHEPLAVPEPSKAKPRPEIPKVRVDRKASIRRPSLDDSGELILENETPVTDKPPKPAGAMAWALGGQLGGGPISLRSAASSPGVASPAPPKEEEEEVQEYEFEFEDVSEPDAGQDGAEGNFELEVEGDYNDADVEEMELPSPAQKHRPSVGATAVNGGDDEDDDMEAQLAAAMAEEEEESEEE